MLRENSWDIVLLDTTRDESGPPDIMLRMRRDATNFLSL